MQKRIIYLLICLLTAGNSFGQKTGIYTNPVIAGDLADPSVIRWGNTYYATGTSSEWAPYFPVFKSTDLINWTQTGHIFNERPKWAKSSFWAPELFSHKGKVFVYYTARREPDGVSYIGVASADDPEKEFTDHGVLIEYGTEAIDAFVFEEEGQLYISWKAYGLDQRPIEILGSRLSADGLRLEGEPFSFLKDTEGIGMEGQYHFKKGEYYYIIYSPRNCCGPESNYEVWVARSKNLRGPYEKYAKNPILRGEGQFLSLGHGTATETPDGRMFYMCHAYFSGAGFYNGRQPVLQEMIMTRDRWLEFLTGNTAQKEQAVPFFRTLQKRWPDFEDNFRSAGLKQEWTWNFPYADAKPEPGEGKLVLTGDLRKGAENGTALCVRSVTSHYSFETRVINKNESMKGLTFYGDDKNLMVFGSAGDSLVLKMIQNGREVLVNRMLLPLPSPYLKVEIAEGYKCTFFWSSDALKWNEIRDFEAVDAQRLLPWDRVCRPGLIHRGENKNRAEFLYFKLKNL